MSVRFGLVGTGQWARRVHAPGLVAHPDVELVGVWGRDRQRAQALADESGCEPYLDADQLFRHVEAVAFAIAPHVQSELAVRAAVRGCDLLLEKPVALTVEAAERVAEAAAGVSTVVFFTGRFAPPTAKWFDEKVIGHLWQGATFRRVGPLVVEGNTVEGWRAEKGTLWDIGPHALAVVLPALGSVEEIAGVRGNGDSIGLALRHIGGATSTLYMSQNAPAREMEIVLWSADRAERAPDRGPQHFPAAYAAAIDMLLRGDDSCSVGLGVEIVRVLAAVERQIGCHGD